MQGIKYATFKAYAISIINNKNLDFENTANI